MRAQQVVASCRTRNLDRTAAGDATRMRGTGSGPPFAGVEAHLEQGHAVSRDPDLGRFGIPAAPVGEAVGAFPAEADPAREHQFVIRVLVVDAENPAPAVAIERMERDGVAVVAELALLCSRGTGREQRARREARSVDRPRAGQQRIAPANHDLAGVVLGDANARPRGYPRWP